MLPPPPGEGRQVRAFDETHDTDRALELSGGFYIWKVETPSLVSQKGTHVKQERNLNAAS